ncbi:hypothetical protein MJO28_009521 [Puccinia striiformis f. sp. tritici]|uniref:Uncharacterized protein n=1 Tax=Puccinia striiformis f. sp. tritici TaxID=168172 RepID=A0ACC0E807_9BASI|nr:hypothetical protein MJO28_009521 [Puccinia striiformis f. sp. tritici]
MPKAPKHSQSTRQLRSSVQSVPNTATLSSTLAPPNQNAPKGVPEKKTIVLSRLIEDCKSGIWKSASDLGVTNLRKILKGYQVTGMSWAPRQLLDTETRFGQSVVPVVPKLSAKDQFTTIQTLLHFKNQNGSNTSIAKNNPRLLLAHSKPAVDASTSSATTDPCLSKNHKDITTDTTPFAIDATASDVATADPSLSKNCQEFITDTMPALTINATASSTAVRNPSLPQNHQNVTLTAQSKSTTHDTAQSTSTTNDHQGVFPTAQSQTTTEQWEKKLNTPSIRSMKGLELFLTEHRISHAVYDNKWDLTKMCISICSRYNDNIPCRRRNNNITCITNRLPNPTNPPNDPLTSQPSPSHQLSMKLTRAQLDQLFKQNASSETSTVPATGPTVNSAGLTREISTTRLHQILMASGIGCDPHDPRITLENQYKDLASIKETAAAQARSDSINISHQNRHLPNR